MSILFVIITLLMVLDLFVFSVTPYSVRRTVHPLVRWAPGGGFVVFFKYIFLK